MPVIIYYQVIRHSGARRLAAGRFKDLKDFTEFVKSTASECGWKEVEVELVHDTTPLEEVCVRS